MAKSVVFFQSWHVASNVIFGRKREMPITQDAYAKDGVNIHVGDYMSKRAGAVCQSTFGNSHFVQVHDSSEGYFRGGRDFSFKNLPDGFRMSSNMDGLGTKVVVHDAICGHRNAAFDLFAMAFGDQTRYGKMPLIMMDQLDVSSLGDMGSPTLRKFEELIDGFQAVAAQSKSVLFNGEIAELGPIISSENSDALTKFVLCGAAIGVSHPDFEITGKDLAPGQVVIALKEEGPRCNGISMYRKAHKLRYGEKWWDVTDAQPSIRAMATPSTLFDQCLIEAAGWIEGKKRIPITAIAHLSGGGLRDKFRNDILSRTGLSAVLDDLWEPPEFMRDCVRWRRLEPGITFGDSEIHATIHGGQGVLVVTPEEHVHSFIAHAAAHGHSAKACGLIMPMENDIPRVTITSMFSGRIFSYPPRV